MSVVINDSCLESLSDISVQNEDWIIQQAIVLLERRVFKVGPRLERPAAVRDYLRLKLVAEPNEIFVVVFMNSMHDVLAVEPMFHGTINATSVYPRVVLQRALQLNAAAVIFAHFVARHKMRILCPVFLCAVLGGQERTSWASGQNRGT